MLHILRKGFSYLVWFLFCVFQVRPGVVSVASRQNQLPTLVFKNGTVVPIQQASGQLIGHFVYLCGLE